MKRIYIIVGLFIIFVASLVVGIIVIQKEERKIFQLEKAYVQTLREYSSYESAVKSIYIKNSRKLSTLPLEGMNDREKKFFIEDFFKRFLTKQSLNGEVVVSRTDHSFLSTPIRTDHINYWELTFEITTYRNIASLISFLEGLENFPLVLEAMDIGFGRGRKKAFIELKYILVEMKGA
ncbi:MAG: hypothetical protein J7J61_05710 [Candidatus Hydrothermae bacterium]|nr:hypothetical protein [Candidatus Hydrothermae bacterium]